MWSSLIVSMLAAYAGFSVASPLQASPSSTQSPAPVTPPPTPSPSIVLAQPQAATTIKSSSTKKSSTSSVHAKPSPQAKYIVTHAEISQHQGDVIPSSNTTATVIQTIEKFNIVTKGVTDGAMPVQCNATWIASLADPSKDAVGTAFSCSDDAVSALLLRQNPDPSVGWWVMIEFNNKNPAMWMQKDLAAINDWTLLPSGMWMFDGNDIASVRPQDSLPQYINQK